MKTCAELDAICDLIFKYDLPKEQIIFMNSREKRETDLLLKSLGSDGIITQKIPSTELKCDTISFGKCTFHIVDTGFIPNI